MECDEYNNEFNEDYSEDYNEDDEIVNNVSADGIDFGRKKKVCEYFRGVKKTSISIAAMQNRFGSTVIPNIRRLYEWEKDVQNVNNRRELLSKFKEALYEKFLMMRSENVIVKDVDLVRVGIEMLKDCKIENFVVSDSYIANFKNKFCIVSRKITKFFTMKDVENEKEYELNAENFVKSIREKIANEKIPSNKIRPKWF
ncbi:hypothetical protein SNEBB_008995 [Seison nebaliae]|nr:hypothetical protein SNEBB_008995 [Seison nebaliae]